MKVVKCGECVLLSKCPSGQRCVEQNSEFERICPVGETKENSPKANLSDIFRGEGI